MAEVLGSDTVVQQETLNAQKFLLGNAELPIAAHRESIISSIDRHAVSIIVAKTGSGKTTQVPQYALEMTRPDGQPYFDEIIVTQPRIVAARSVSERIEYEVRAAAQHHKIGYYTSKEGSETPQHAQDVSLLTDGKAAAQLHHSFDLPRSDKKRLLILDEVHEQNLNIEDLLALSHELTDPSSERYDPNLKVVIMSATMDSSRLKEHFKHAAGPVIEVPAFTHPVERTTTGRSMASMAITLAKDGGKVLAFFPGKREIKNFTNEVEKRVGRGPQATKVIPLHGQQSAGEQQLAFEEYPHGAIVATTNAAETSLTVPDVTAVVDSGQMREDAIGYKHIPTGTDGLYLVSATQANIDQRAGRAGRTAPGEHVLCPPDGESLPVRYDKRKAFATPAIQRTRLDGLVLRYRATGTDIDPERFFNKPPARALNAAQQRLKILGALDNNGNITERGRFMESLPLDTEYSCMLAFASERNYLIEVQQNLLDIAAIMQLGGVVKRAPKETAWRELLAEGPDGKPLENESDFIAQLEVYRELIANVPRDEWSRYDIIEYSADRVEQARASLADKLGVELHAIQPVARANRQAVLTSIHAGQLAQVWQRKGDAWEPLLGGSGEFKLAESSVVENIGKLATGSLFTLGLRNKTIDSIQNVNRVVGAQSLEQAARHLVKEVPQAGATYNMHEQQLYKTVHHMLGNFLLRTSQQVIHPEAGTPESEALRAGHQVYAWEHWSERKAPTQPYTIETIEAVLEDPESMQYGTDPVTGEALMAWRGGTGKWLPNREVAIDSLRKCNTRLHKAPDKAALRDTKEAIRTVDTSLRRLKQHPDFANEIKQLTAAKRKMDKADYLTAANELLARARA